MISRLLLQLQDTGSFRQIFRNDRQCGFSRFAGTLQQYLCKSVECLYLKGAGIGVGRTFRSLISGISIPHPKDAYRTGDGYRQVVAGSGDKTFLLVLQLNVTHCHIPIVCLNDGDGLPSGEIRAGAPVVSTVRANIFFAVLIAYSLHCTGLENGFPGRWPFRGIGLRSSFLPFTVNSTSSQLLYTQMSMLSPS